MPGPETALLRKHIELALVAACRRRLPYETCGILFGRVTEAAVEADGFAVIRNAARQPGAAFAFEPEDWTAAFYSAREDGREMIGVFHSHPGGLPSPSGQDLSGSLPWRSSWIIAVTPDTYEIAAYLRTAGDRGWQPLRLISA